LADVRRSCLNRALESRWGFPCALAALWIAIGVAVNPIGNFPLDDDWAWGGSVRTLAESHRLVIVGWAGMSLVAQIAGGALLSVIFGFSYSVLHLACQAAGLVSVLSLYALGRALGAARPVSFVAALAFAVNPLVVQLSSTFMTDVPFAAMLSLSLAGLGWSLRSGARAGLAAIALLPIAATLTRQVGLAIPLAMAIGCIIGRRLDLRHLIALMVAGFGSWVGLDLYERWLARTGQMSGYYGEQAHVALQILGHPRLWAKMFPRISTRFEEMFIYIGFFSLPVLPMMLWRRWEARRRERWAALGAALIFAALTLVWLAGPQRRMPFDHGFTLTDFGLGPITLTDVYLKQMPHVPTLDPRLWTGVTFLGALGGCGVVFVLILSLMQLVGRERSAEKALAASALAYAGGYFLVLITAKFLFDRYLITLFIAWTLAALWNGREAAPRWVLAAALAGLLPIALFSVGATHDYLAWNRARWKALHDLQTVYRVSPEQIDGGFEFNGQERYGKASRPGKAWWWVEDDRYMVTMGGMPGYHVFFRVPYARWLGPRDSSIFVMERNP
jgi:Dolichyl-phosphate-mannose-protein mannosyltransferase